MEILAHSHLALPHSNLSSTGSQSKCSTRSTVPHFDYPPRTRSGGSCRVGKRGGDAEMTSLSTTLLIYDDHLQSSKARDKAEQGRTTYRVRPVAPLEWRRLTKADNLIRVNSI
ncbi:hypothetical protein BaRGS_00040079 [Batillaria attramentaria]|uniref:Uncharacterized protein n=1 Tax=Batillaria attramentaria TaxID=370345 RepID=A0ABD0J212_9CAEN